MQCSPSCIARHLYVVAEPAADGKQPPALSTTLKMPAAAFSERYPGFAAWLAANAGALEREHPPLKFRPEGGRGGGGSRR